MSEPQFVDRAVVIRIVKPYPEARSHIYLGKVVAYDGRFIGIDGCVLHFGRATLEDPTGGLTTSGRAVRWVFRDRVEYILELPDGMDPYDPEQLTVSPDGSLKASLADRPDLLPD